MAFPMNPCGTRLPDKHPHKNGRIVIGGVLPRPSTCEEVTWTAKVISAEPKQAAYFAALCRPMLQALRIQFAMHHRKLRRSETGGLLAQNGEITPHRQNPIR